MHLIFSPIGGDTEGVFKVLSFFSFVFLHWFLIHRSKLLRVIPYHQKVVHVFLAAFLIELPHWSSSRTKYSNFFDLLTWLGAMQTALTGLPGIILRVGDRGISLKLYVAKGSARVLNSNVFSQKLCIFHPGQPLDLSPKTTVMVSPISKKPPITFR